MALNSAKASNHFKNEIVKIKVLQWKPYQTESPIFIILFVLCFQRQSFLTFILEYPKKCIVPKKSTRMENTFCICRCLNKYYFVLFYSVLYDVSSSGFYL